MSPAGTSDADSWAGPDAHSLSRHGALAVHVEEKRDADLDNTKSASSKEELGLKWGPEAPASSQTAWHRRETAVAQDDDLSSSGIDIQGPFFNTADEQHPTLGVEEWTSRRAPLGFGDSTGLRRGGMQGRYE